MRLISQVQELGLEIWKESSLHFTQEQYTSVHLKYRY